MKKTLSVQTEVVADPKTYVEYKLKVSQTLEHSPTGEEIVEYLSKPAGSPLHDDLPADAELFRQKWSLPIGEAMDIMLEADAKLADQIKSKEEEASTQTKSKVQLSVEQLKDRVYTRLKKVVADLSLAYSADSDDSEVTTLLNGIKKTVKAAQKVAHQPIPPKQSETSHQPLA